jgi:hypothetical protein
MFRHRSYFLEDSGLNKQKLTPEQRYRFKSIAVDRKNASWKEDDEKQCVSNLRVRSYINESVPDSVKRAAKSKNFTGPNGSKAIGYQWQWKWDVKFSKAEDGMVDARVSDWDSPLKCKSCNRNIVHVYWVQDKDGNIYPYGGDHLHIALGYPSEIAKSKLISIRKKITNLENTKKHDAAIKDRYKSIISNLSSNSIGGANELAMKHGFGGGAMPPKWLINHHTGHMIRASKIDIDRFLQFTNGWIEGTMKDAIALNKKNKDLN